MKTINFKEFVLSLDVAQKQKQTIDVREVFANILYARANGIQAHSLAFMIYKSEGNLEITGDEERIIIAVAQQHTTPAFIDGIMAQLNENNLEEKQ
ncbi:hypothetical protein FACS1894207_4600 [Bacteroidia bacterium]|nr:hypothetical protein FACS1894207_4600 [Bacteroidia bacterium]